MRLSTSHVIDSTSEEQVTQWTVFFRFNGVDCNIIIDTADKMRRLLICVTRIIILILEVSSHYLHKTEVSHFQKSCRER